jgi:peptidoglycan/LPS O-acetylase OafA/YrhL
LTAKSSQRFYILDPLRLVAAFAVVFYHYLPLVKDTNLGVVLSPFKYGYLGVNFFFILSGFVIMASCQNRGAFQFAVARALRIYPAFFACLLVTLAVVYASSRVTASPLQIISNALIVNDYIGQPNIDGVYWTLQAELKFYGCIFLLSLFGFIQYWRIWLSLWLLAAITYHFYGQPFFLGWFISPAYSFYFIGGVTAYLISKNPRNIFVLLLFCLALIFSCIKSFHQAAGFIGSANPQDGIIAALVVALFFMVFYLLANGKLQIAQNPYWLLMGAISYPLYLIHNRSGKAIYSYIHDFLDDYCALGLVLIIIVSISLCIHLYVERKVFLLFKVR